MQTSTFVYALSALAAGVNAIDMTAYQAGTGVEAGLEAFLTTYFPFSEDTLSTTEWTNWWAETGSITHSSGTYVGAADRLALKQRLLPPGGNTTWNHIISEVTVVNETATSKTYNEAAIVEIRNTAQQVCYGFQGSVVAEIKKNAAGEVDLTLHGGNYLTYVLNLPTAANVECTF